MKYLIGLSFLVLSKPSFAQQIKLTHSASDSIGIENPMVIIDGKVMPQLVKSKADTTKLVSPMQNIDDSQIQDITVLKGPDALTAVGEAGKNGFVKIRLKKKYRIFQ